MIIEPTPTNPRSPLRRATRALGLVTPIALLVAVVGGGVLGQGAAAPSSAPSQAAAATPQAPDGSGAPPAGAKTAMVGSVFPAVADGLAVRTVTEALSARSDRTQDRVVAVSGYLGRLSGDAGCSDPPLVPLGPLCVRSGLLVEPPWATSDGGRTLGIGLDLRAAFPVGVGLPDEVVRVAAGAGRAPVPAVLLGRFNVAGVGRRPGGIRCGNEFTVDRVAWVNGSAVPVRAVIDAGVDGQPAEWILQHQGLAEVAAIGWSGNILVVALVRPSTLEKVDPIAAATAAAEGTARPAGLVWYVRGLETGYDPIRYPMWSASPRLSWVVLDDVTGTILARGSAAQPTS